MSMLRTRLRVSWTKRLDFLLRATTNANFRFMARVTTMTGRTFLRPFVALPKTWQDCGVRCVDIASPAGSVYEQR
jgi:hypothetical protein